jgi:hypothetical protein
MPKIDIGMIEREDGAWPKPGQRRSKCNGRFGSRQCNKIRAASPGRKACRKCLA